MLNIVLSPDTMLNQVSEPCMVPDADLSKLAKDMEEAMYAYDGVGIAAPQVGVLKRMIVVDCTEERDGALVLVNPELIEAWGDEVVEEEGCLSCPGISIPIKRKEWAKVRFLDLEGQGWEIESDGLLGRCLQHEIDHLDGITIFERCAPRDRIKALAAYEEAKKCNARPGDTSSGPRVR